MPFRCDLSALLFFCYLAIENWRYKVGLREIGPRTRRKRSERGLGGSRCSVDISKSFQSSDGAEVKPWKGQYTSQLVLVDPNTCPAHLVSTISGRCCLIYCRTSFLHLAYRWCDLPLPSQMRFSSGIFCLCFFFFSLLRFFSLLFLFDTFLECWCLQLEHLLISPLNPLPYWLVAF